MTLKDLMLLTMPSMALYSYPDKLHIVPTSGTEFVACYYVDHYKGYSSKEFFVIPVPERLQDVFFDIQQSVETMEDFAYELKMYFSNPSYYVKSRNI